MNENSRFELTEKNVINDIIELDKKITEEVNSENPNKKEIEKLRWKQLMRGLWINHLPNN
jgi:hypothetical protein